MSELAHRSTEPTVQVAVRTPAADSVATVIEISGAMCTATMQRIRQQIAAASVGTGADVVVDLSGVDFIDGRGLSLLMTTRQAVEECGHRLCVGSASPIVRRLLAITTLDDVLLDHRVLHDSEGPS